MTGAGTDTAGSPRFEAGERVVVTTVTAEYKRRPEYTEGATGVVDAVHGRYRPGSGDDREYLYSVRFDPADLWTDPERNEAVYVDLWESALARAAGDGESRPRDEP